MDFDIDGNEILGIKGAVGAGVLGVGVGSGEEIGLVVSGKEKLILGLVVGGIVAAGGTAVEMGVGLGVGLGVGAGLGAELGAELGVGVEGGVLTWGAMG